MMKGFIRMICSSIVSMLLFVPLVHAAANDAVVVNYYQTIQTFNANNSVPVGNFIQGLTFSGTMNVTIANTTNVKILYASNDCYYVQGSSGNSYGNWHRYVIVPSQVVDNSGKILGTFTSNPTYTVQLGGITYYVYLFNTTLGSVHSCTVGNVSGQAIVSATVGLPLDVTLTAVSNTVAITSGTYEFDIPVRLASILNDPGASVWGDLVVGEQTVLHGIFTVPINNYCKVDDHTNYTFDFGALTEAAATTLSSLDSAPQSLNVSCSDTATLKLDFTTATPSGGAQNKVLMSNSSNVAPFFAELYIDGISQSAVSYPTALTHSIPLKAVLRKVSGVTDIDAGNYSGAGVLKVTIE